MNGERTFGQVMASDKMNALLNVTYNKWFLKWARQPLTDQAWNTLMAEADQIMSQGEQYPVVRHLVISLLYELDARMHGGYTETSRDKLLAMIAKEGKA